MCDSFHSYIKTTLGGPTPAEYEAVCAQRDSLKEQVEKLQQDLEAVRAELEAKVQIDMKKGAFF
jgi:hypothetical protein